VLQTPGQWNADRGKQKRGKNCFASVVILLSLAVTRVVLGAEQAAPIGTNMPIKDLSLPLEHFENGSIKTQLKADFARVPPNGIIEALKVKVEFYNENGDVEVLMLSDDCRYDRESGQASSESSVYLERTDVVITGTGFTWDGKEQVIRILHDVTVVLKRIRKAKGKNSGE